MLTFTPARRDSPFFGLVEVRGMLLVPGVMRGSPSYLYEGHAERIEGHTRRVQREIERLGIRRGVREDR